MAGEAQDKAFYSDEGNISPLTIDPLQEEGLRKAAKNIEQLANENLKAKLCALGISKMWLAMCALQFASQDWPKRNRIRTEGVKEAAERT